MGSWRPKDRGRPLLFIFMGQQIKIINRRQKCGGVYSKGSLFRIVPSFKLKESVPINLLSR
jgi:hypothetical protein